MRVLVTITVGWRIPIRSTEEIRKPLVHQPQCFTPPVLLYPGSLSFSLRFLKYSNGISQDNSPTPPTLLPPFPPSFLLFPKPLRYSIRSFAPLPICHYNRTHSSPRLSAVFINCPPPSSSFSPHLLLLLQPLHCLALLLFLFSPTHRLYSSWLYWAPFAPTAIVPRTLDPPIRLKLLRSFPHPSRR